MKKKQLLRRLRKKVEWHLRYEHCNQIPYSSIHPTFQDAEARISVLRERAGVGASAKERRREDEKRERELLKQAIDPDARAAAVSSNSSSGALGNGKHINLFEDLEQASLIKSFFEANSFMHILAEYFTNIRVSPKYRVPSQERKR